ncbi:MAG: zf-TFIIB domain-containing protein [Candidatus Krumholzibacteria bacterium]|nr:zf-TFIIB domain-containing protein [Candidatus Krumholzibacteria bacterium]MDH4338187.1 zf-TFIIB domain-containing protein [Candidatus Krumholzibacteria bacterium]MDH5269824.1 zf-TFIIB domain-containing protein [Candidatus Krumholzibacteria bacterium]
MNCPRCEKPIVALELNQIEVDHCLKCGGVWLDPDEMDLLLAGSAGREEIRANMRPDDGGGERTIRCPMCEKKMAKVRVARDNGVGLRIDRCENGHGTWLDGGELHALVALSDFPAADRIHDFLSAIFRGPQAGSRS